MSCNTYYIHTPTISYGPFDQTQAQACLVARFNESPHPHSWGFAFKRAKLIMDLFIEHQADYLPLELTPGEHLWITTPDYNTSLKSHPYSQESSSKEHSNNVPEQQTFALGADATSTDTTTTAHTAS